MIVFRRIVAVILAFLFVLLYISVLFVFRANDTALNPQFYVDQLRKDDIYNFAYQQVLPAALDQATAPAGSNNSFDVSKYKSNITTFAQQALPPVYVQSHVENAIKTVLPYLLGDVDTFTLQIPLKDRLTTSVSALKTQLNEPGLFAGLYDQFLTQMLDQIYESGSIPQGVSKTDFEAALRQAAPPAWLLAQLNDALDQVTPYMTGEQAHFTIKIKITDRLDAVQTMLVNVLKSQTSYDSMMKTVTDAVMQQNLARNLNLPSGITFSDQEVRQAIQAALPIDWYQSMVSDIVKQVLDYLKGTKASLNVSLTLADRKPQIAAAIINAAAGKLAAHIDSLPSPTPDQLKQLLLSPFKDQIPPFRPAGLTYTRQGDVFAITVNASQWLPTIQSSLVDGLNQQSAYDQFIGQLQTQVNAKGTQTLPIGLSIEPDDFNQAIAQALPVTWYRTATTGMTQQVVSYINGTSDNANVTMQLADRKPSISAALAAVADQKMRTYVNSLPPATTPEQLAWWANPPKNQLPTSIPPGVTYDQIKSTLGIDFQQQTQTVVNSSVPNQWVLSQSELGSALGSTSPTFLTDARELVKNGMRVTIDLGAYIRPAMATSLPDTMTLTQNDLNVLIGSQDLAAKMREYAQNGVSFTDADIRNRLGNNAGRLDTVRNYIARGFVFTDADLHKLIAGQGEQAVSQFDEIRHTLGTARKWLMMLWLLPGLILVEIGFLGGKNWAGRLIWAASALAVAAAVVFVVTVAEPQIQKLLMGFGEGTTQMNVLLNNKGKEVVENALNSFLTGTRIRAVVTLVISLAGIAFGVVWGLRKKNNGKQVAQ